MTACNSCQSHQAKPTKPKLLNQTKPTKLTEPTYQTKSKSLVKAVDAWVRSAFGNVLALSWMLAVKVHEQWRYAILVGKI